MASRFVITLAASTLPWVFALGPTPCRAGEESPKTAATDKAGAPGDGTTNVAPDDAKARSGAEDGDASLRAENEDAVRKATARDLAVTAADAFDAGDYATALDGFHRAQQLYPAPTLALMEGRSLYELGRWVEAYEKYVETAQTPLGADATAAFQTAVADAAALAQTLRTQLPRLNLQTTSPNEIIVRIDGWVVPKELLNISRPIDPGKRLVEASTAERVYFTRSVKLTAAAQVSLNIPAPPTEKAAVAAPAAQVVAAPPSPPPEAAEPVSRAPGWIAPVAFGVGGLGLGGAVVGRIMAARTADELDERCTPGCPPSQQDQLDEFRTYKALYYVGAGVAAVGVGVGLYFTFSDEGEEGTVALGLSPQGASLRGSF